MQYILTHMQYIIGLKHKVFISPRTKTLDVKKFDDSFYKKAIYSTGWTRASSLLRWKELFGNGVKSNRGTFTAENSAIDKFGLEDLYPLPMADFNDSTASKKKHSKETVSPHAQQSSSETFSLSDQKLPSHLSRKSLDTMSDKEWIEWVEYAASKRAEFEKLLQTRQLNDRGWKQLLKVDSLPAYHMSKHPLTYSDAVDTDNTTDKSVQQPVMGT